MVTVDVGLVGIRARAILAEMVGLLLAFGDCDSGSAIERGVLIVR